MDPQELAALLAPSRRLADIFPERRPHGAWLVFSDGELSSTYDERDRLLMQMRPVELAPLGVTPRLPEVWDRHRDDRDITFAAFDDFDAALRLAVLVREMRRGVAEGGL